jgi:hypothetical protein
LVAFIDKIPESFTFDCGKISDNANSDAIVGRFLKYLAGKTGFEIKEILIDIMFL